MTLPDRPLSKSEAVMAWLRDHPEGGRPSEIAKALGLSLPSKLGDQVYLHVAAGRIERPIVGGHDGKPGRYTWWRITDLGREWLETALLRAVTQGRPVGAPFKERPPADRMPRQKRAIDWGWFEDDPRAVVKTVSGPICGGALRRALSEPEWKP